MTDPLLPRVPPPGLVATALDANRIRFTYPVGTPPLDALSAAEREVVVLALQGRTNKEIAAARGSSPRTVANLIARAFRKLRVGSRTELAAAVFRR